jgi:hypothetical protein
VFQQICRDILLQLAPSCPRSENAFGLTTRRTGLGIVSDSSILTWQLPPQKHYDIMLQAIFEAQTVTPKQFQNYMGKRNDFGQVCPFLRGFRFNQNSFLKALAEQTQQESYFPGIETGTDYMGKVYSILAAKSEFLIPLKHEQPPLYPYQFISDAVVEALSWVAGKQRTFLNSIIRV